MAIALLWMYAKVIAFCFAKYGGTEFKLDGEEYLVLKENDILAIIG